MRIMSFFFQGSDRLCKGVCFWCLRGSLQVFECVEPPPPRRLCLFYKLLSWGQGLTVVQGQHSYAKHQSQDLGCRVPGGTLMIRDLTVRI